MEAELLQHLAEALILVITALIVRLYPMLARKANLSKFELTAAEQSIIRRCVTQAVLWVEGEFITEPSETKASAARNKSIIEARNHGIDLSPERAIELIPSVLAELGIGPSAKPKPDYEAKAKDTPA